jgi:hypothetical protein
LHNLFGAFGTTLDSIPAFASYLQPSQEKIRIRKQVLLNNGKTKIGICWRSANESSSIWTQGRSVDLATLASVFDPERHDLICLQKECNEAELTYIDEHPWIHLPAEKYTDMDDTAAVALQLDMVVTTCTVIPHLSGALGVPTRLLLSKNSCWRWMDSGERTPWYPSLQLVRQQKLGDWSMVLDRLRQEFGTTAG